MALFVYHVRVQEIGKVLRDAPNSQVGMQSLLNLLRKVTESSSTTQRTTRCTARPELQALDDELRRARAAADLQARSRCPFVNSHHERDTVVLARHNITTGVALAKFFAVFSLVLFNGAGQEHFHFDLLALTGPRERYPVGALLVFDLEGEVFPKYLCPVRLPALALGGGDLEVYDPEELGVGGARLRSGDRGERGYVRRAAVERMDAPASSAAQGGEKGRRPWSAA